MYLDTAQRLKINTLADLVAYAKANPAKLNSFLRATADAVAVVVQCSERLDRRHLPRG